MAWALSTCTLCSAISPVKASIYSHRFDGRRTASGSAYTPQGLTVAHRYLPFGTRLRLYNVKTKKSIVVTVTDRGPYVRKYSLDLSPAVATRLGFTYKEGWAWVTMHRLNKRPIERTTKRKHERKVLLWSQTQSARQERR